MGYKVSNKGVNVINSVKNVLHNNLVKFHYCAYMSTE